MPCGAIDDPLARWRRREWSSRHVRLSDCRPFDEHAGRKELVHLHPRVERQLSEDRLDLQDVFDFGATSCAVRHQEHLAWPARVVAAKRVSRVLDEVLADDGYGSMVDDGAQNVVEWLRLEGVHDWRRRRHRLIRGLRRQPRASRHALRSWSCS